MGDKTTLLLYLLSVIITANSTYVLLSVISRLVDICAYVIIEDADLRPQDIIDHMAVFSLQSSAILDMTRVLGLTGNHVYLIWSKKEANNPDLAGERIW